MKPPKRTSESTEIVVVRDAPLVLFAGPPEQNPYAQYMMNLKSKASRRSITIALDRAARIFDAIDRGWAPEDPDVNAKNYPWGALDMCARPGCREHPALSYAKASAAVNLVAAEVNPHTGKEKTSAARLMCSALKQVARYSFNLSTQEYPLLDATTRMKIDDIEPPELDGETKGRRLEDDEVERLYVACRGDSELDRRDAAIFALGIGGGPRRFELSALDLDDYKRPARVGRDSVEFVIRRGKGKKHGEVIAPPDVAVAVERWLDVRGREPGPLFTSSPGRGRGLDPDSRLSASGVYNIVERRGRQAQIRPAITPHDMRRTAITRFLERVKDLSLAQKFARHSDPKTTSKYDTRTKAALLAAFEKVSSGYKG